MAPVFRLSLNNRHEHLMCTLYTSLLMLIINSGTYRNQDLTVGGGGVNIISYV